MSPERNSPGIGTEAVKSSGENVPPILPEFEPYSPDFNPFTFKLLPAIPGNDLDRIFEARLLGFSEAWEAQQATVDRVSELADLWYLRANNTPDEIKEIERRHTDKNYAAYERQFMAGEAA